MELDLSKSKEGVAAIMRRAGLHPSIVYAFLKTGMLVGEDSPHTAAERQDWIDAVEEWHAQNGGE